MAEERCECPDCLAKAADAARGLSTSTETVRTGWAMRIVLPRAKLEHEVQYLQNPTVPPRLSRGCEPDLSESTVFTSPTEVARAVIKWAGTGEMPEGLQVEMLQVIQHPNGVWASMWATKPKKV